jgi:predicted  nucleic acid-binding Zn-ribbon protein
MANFEALWAYQTEDIKADAIANAIRRSPVRQKLEKTRDLILDRQKQYKQIEVEITAMADRKDIISQAVEHSEAQLQSLKNRFESDPPATATEVKALMAEVSHCRDTIRQYEAEIARIVKESSAHEKQQYVVRVDAANAKKAFDQLKAEYEAESQSKKAELDEQRAKAKALAGDVDPALLEEYSAIKKHISPPVARLTHGQCSGCNTSLPSAILSKIKNGSLVECETCGRMIIQ